MAITREEREYERVTKGCSNLNLIQKQLYTLIEQR